MSSARVGVPVPGQTPRRINFDQYVRQVCVVQNSATQRLLRWLLLPKLQHDEERRRPPRVCQLTRGAKYLTGYRDAAFDRRVGPVGHDQLRERSEARALFGWQPDKTGSEMWSILI